MPRPPVVIPAKPGAPPAADLAQYQAAFDDVPTSSISDASKAQYKNQLKRLTETIGHGVEWILSHGKAARRLLIDAKRTDGKRMLDEPMTLKAMIDALVALLRHVPGLGERYKGVREQWDELYRHTSDTSNERYENNQATEKSAANFVPWAEIVEKRDALIRRSPAGSMDVVVAAMHTFIPPARADYNRVRVYRPPLDPPPPPLSEDDENDDEKNGKSKTKASARKPVVKGVEVERVPNYVVWTTTGGKQRNHQMHLVLDEFKTRKKKKVAHEADLPADLVAVLAKSLEAEPRKWLVVSPENGEPYENADSYAKCVTRVFSRLLGRHTTVNSLRHAFSSQLDLNTLTPKQRREIADALMHSPEMTHRYRYANVEGATSSSTSVASATVGAHCELVCTKGKAKKAAVLASSSGGGGTTPSKAERYRAAIELFERKMLEAKLVDA